MAPQERNRGQAALSHAKLEQKGQPSQENLTPPQQQAAEPKASPLQQGAKATEPRIGLPRQEARPPEPEVKSEDRSGVGVLRFLRLPVDKTTVLILIGIASLVISVLTVPGWKDAIWARFFPGKKTVDTSTPLDNANPRPPMQPSGPSRVDSSPTPQVAVRAGTTPRQTAPTPTHGDKSRSRQVESESPVPPVSADKSRGEPSTPAATTSKTELAAQPRAVPIAGPHVELLTVNKEPMDGKTVVGIIVEKNGSELVDFKNVIRNSGETESNDITLRLLTKEPLKVGEKSAETGFDWEEIISPIQVNPQRLKPHIDYEFEHQFQLRSLPPSGTYPVVFRCQYGDNKVVEVHFELRLQIPERVPKDLAGLWVVNLPRGTTPPLPAPYFIEFLQHGRVSVRETPEGPSAISPELSWYLTPTGLHLVGVKKDKTRDDVEFTRYGDYYDLDFRDNKGRVAEIKIERVR
jgi:hypothetical protein